MPTSLPLLLLVSYVGLVMFLVGHSYHEKNMAKSFDGLMRSRLFEAVRISSLLGALSAIGLLIFYFVKVKWYWAGGLLVVGAMLGSVVAGMYMGQFGEERLSKRAFVGWPVCAALSLLAIWSLK